MKFIVKASRELHRPLTRSVEREERRREKIREKKGADGFRPRNRSTNGMANKYLVWIRWEPIAMRDVLPHSREKRQSGVLAVGVTLGKKNGEGWKERRGKGNRGGAMARRLYLPTRLIKTDRLPCLPCQIIPAFAKATVGVWYDHISSSVSVATYLRRSFTPTLPATPRCASTPFFGLHRCPLNIVSPCLAPSIDINASLA